MRVSARIILAFLFGVRFPTGDAECIASSKVARVFFEVIYRY